MPMAATAQVDQAAPAAQAVVAPQAVAVILRAARAPVIPQRRPVTPQLRPVTPQRPRKAAIRLVTRLAFRNHPIRRFNRLELTGFSNRYPVPAIQRSIETQTTKNGG